MLKHREKYNIIFRISLILTVLLFYSCTENTIEKKDNFKVEDAQIIFYIEDSLLNDLIDSLLETTFTAPIEGLLQNEPLFSAIIVNNPREVTIELNKHKNVLQVINIKSTEPKDKVSIKSEEKFISSVYWQNNIIKLQEDLKRLMLIIEAREIEVIRKSMARNSQKNIQKNLFNNFDVELIIPKKYNTVFDRKDFFWANYDPSDKEEIKNICVFSFDSEKTDLHNQVLLKVDSVFKKYFLGEAAGTYATIDKEFPVSISDNLYRGVWKLEGGFMGGVFIFKTYTIASKTTVCLGLVFDPANTKRRHVKEFEAIL